MTQETTKQYDYVFTGDCPMSENPEGTHFTSEVKNLTSQPELWLSEIEKAGYDVARHSDSIDVERYNCKCSQCKCKV